MRSFTTKNIFTLMLLTAMLVVGGSGMVKGQIKNYATISPSIGVTKATIGLFASPAADDATGGSVLTPEQAAVGDDLAFATLTANFTATLVTGTVGEAWLQLKFPQSVGAGKTTYIRFDPVTTAGLKLDLLGLVSDLTGLLRTNLVKLEAYSGATAGSVGTKISEANVTAMIVRDPQGNNYFAVTSTSSYNSVRIRLSFEPKLLAIANGSVSMKVYNGFYLTEEDCSPSLFASVGEYTGVNVTLTELVKTPEKAIDKNLGTSSQLQTGLVGLGSTISQTVFLNGLSKSDDYAKVYLSVPASILNLNLFNTVTVQAYNGNTAIGTAKSVSSLLTLDLLGLLAKTNIIPVFFKPGAPFNNVKISIDNTLAVGGNILQGGLNIHEVQKTVNIPSFDNIVNHIAPSVCGDKVSFTVKNPDPTLEYFWYRKILPNKTRTPVPIPSPATSLSQSGLLPGDYVYYLSAQNKTCAVESDMDSAQITIKALPLPPSGTALPICSGNQGTFKVTSPTAGHSYNWYASATDGIPIMSGSVATTPSSLSATTTYYLEGIDPATTCSSVRTPVTITVNPLPSATISSSVSACQNSASPTVTFTGSGGTAPYEFSYTINNGTILTAKDLSGNIFILTISTGSPDTFVYKLISVKDSSSTSCTQTITGQSATIKIDPLPHSPPINPNTY